MCTSRNISLAVITACVLNVALSHVNAETLVSPGWDPVLAGDRVMERLVTVTAPQVKGAHDAEMALVGNHAYIVAEVNDVRPGESAGWPEVYAAMSIVKLNSLQVVQIIPFARSEQVFDNVTLPVGACFVPRILQKDATTLRSYFASEQPGKRQAVTWYRDFDIPSRTFANTIHKAKLKTAVGVFDMEPRRFHADAVAHGFSKPAKDYGLYLFDSFKAFDGRTYVAINNWPGKQNALALVHDDYATFEVLGHYNEPQSAKLSESAVNRLPDSTWMAICRNDGGNYHFTTSREGREWTVGREMPFVPNGANSKPTFDRFGDVYYLGWQEATRIDGVRRSVFNIDVSRDGKSWQRKYRFVTKKSFQYPTFHEHDGNVWLCVTQGVFSPSRKERIMFGKLEKTGNLSTTSDESRDKVSALPRTLGIPTVDISGERERHVVINAGTEALYQGHANTLLLPDRKTMFCVWTLNHGWGEPFLKRSGDAGKTWAEVPIPANWNDSWCKHTDRPGSTLGGTSRGWLPTIHHLVGPDGKGRLFIWDRGKDNRMNQSVSEDDGKTWSPMRENGLTGCIEPSMNVIAYGDGRKHLMWFTDWTPSVHQAVSRDGGLTWEQRSSVIDTSEVPGVKMIEPGVVRSPDGQQLLMLIRDFAKGGKYNSLYAISNDEGATWSKPKRLPASLTGDRHCPVYAPGGRLVVLMRDKLPSKQSPTAGHFIAWVGRYEDILAGRPGQYRIKLLHSHAGRDCAYPSVHLLQDGDFIATTYIKYEAGPRHQSTISARFNLPELDRRIEASDDSILAPLGYHLMDPSGDSASDASCQEQHCSNDVRRSLRIANLQGPHGRLLTVATGH